MTACMDSPPKSRSSCVRSALVMTKQFEKNILHCNQFLAEHPVSAR